MGYVECIIYSVEVGPRKRRCWSVNLPGVNNREKYSRLSKGFTDELVEQLRMYQNGCCAICDVPLEFAKGANGECADHCHVNNVPRGLLCLICNLSLGYYEARQRPNGLIIEPYEKYLAEPPVSKLPPK